MLALIKKIISIFVNNPVKVFFTLLVLGLIVWRVNLARKPDFEVDVVSANKQTFVESVSIAGEIKAKNSADLTFVAAELISDIYVEDGAWVKKGERIASLNTSNLFQDLLIAEATLRDKTATLDRVYNDLKDVGHESFEEIEKRTSAETAKDAAVFAHIKAQRNLANATIRAPFDGIINFKDGVSVGKYASAAAPSFNITDPSTTYFEAEISELDVTRLKTGMKALIELDAYPQDSFEQVVEVVGFESVVTSSGGTAYKTKITLPENFEKKFRLGMNGDAELIVSEKEEVLSIPTSGLVEEEDKKFVWKVVGGRVTKAKVEIGATAINDTEIVNGVSEGDTVVLRPPSKLKEGDRVKVKS